MAVFKLHQLELKMGDRLRMDYDFGTTQTFNIELMSIEEIPPRFVMNRYPPP